MASVSSENEPEARMLCKYGAKCYQKNTTHLAKYKHPSKRKSSTENSDDDVANHDVKKVKRNEQPEAQNDDSNAPIDRKEFIFEKFLVRMPKDFYDFWVFCEELNKNKPEAAFKDVGLSLVGPYDVMAGKFDNIEKPEADYLIHWRFYYDPPEFQTVLVGDQSSGYHIGYFRDDPSKFPVFLAYNYAKKTGELFPIGQNIFAAVNLYLENMKKSADPFKKLHVNKLQTKIKARAGELGYEMEEKTKKMKERDNGIVTRTFNRIGLVVPYNKKTQLGYRKIACGNKELKDLLTRLAKASEEEKNKILAQLQQTFTYASIATDECDFGTGLELGLDILSFGGDTLNFTIQKFMSTSYKLLNRDPFAKIIEAHMSNRKNDVNLSII